MTLFIEGADSNAWTPTLQDIESRFRLEKVLRRQLEYLDPVDPRDQAVLEEAKENLDGGADVRAVLTSLKFGPDKKATPPALATLLRTFFRWKDRLDLVSSERARDWEKYSDFRTHPNPNPDPRAFRGSSILSVLRELVLDPALTIHVDGFVLGKELRDLLRPEMVGKNRPLSVVLEELKSTADQEVHNTVYTGTPSGSDIGTVVDLNTAAVTAATLMGHRRTTHAHVFLVMYAFLALPGFDRLRELWIDCDKATLRLVAMTID